MEYNEGNGLKLIDLVCQRMLPSCGQLLFSFIYRSLLQWLRYGFVHWILILDVAVFKTFVNNWTLTLRLLSGQFVDIVSLYVALETLQTSSPGPENICVSIFSEERLIRRFPFQIEHKMYILPLLCDRIRGYYLYQKHVIFISNTWGSSLLSSRFYLVCLLL